MLEVSSQWGLRLTFGLDGAGWASRRQGGERRAYQRSTTDARIGWNQVGPYGQSCHSGQGVAKGCHSAVASGLARWISGDQRAGFGLRPGISRRSPPAARPRGFPTHDTGPSCGVGRGRHARRGAGAAKRSGLGGAARARLCGNSPVAVPRDCRHSRIRGRPGGRMRSG